MRYYYVQSISGFWFVVKSSDLVDARRTGVEEFGRGRVDLVREATDDEIDCYINNKGREAMGG